MNLLSIINHQPYLYQITNLTMNKLKNYIAIIISGTTILLITIFLITTMILNPIDTITVISLTIACLLIWSFYKLGWMIGEWKQKRKK